MMWFRRRRQRALVCRDAVALMSAYLDGALTKTERARLEAHLAACPNCSEYLAQIRATIDALGQIDVDELPEHMVDDLVDLYRRWQSG